MSSSPTTPAPPPPNADPVPAVRFIDRLRFQFQYLLTFGPEVAAERLAGLRSGDDSTVSDLGDGPDAFAGEVRRRHGIASTELHRRDTLTDWLRRALTGGLTLLSRTIPDLEVAGACELGASPEAVGQWLWKKRLWQPLPAPLSENAVRCVWQSHLLLLAQRTAPRQSGHTSESDRLHAKSLQLARQNLAVLHRCRLSTGDLISHLLGTWSVRMLAGPEFDHDDPQREAGWTATIDRLSPEVRTVFLQSAGLNRLLAPESGGIESPLPALCAAVTQAGGAPAREAIRLGRHVQQELARLQSFSHQLVLQEGRPQPGPPITIARVAHQEVPRFSGQTSPALTEVQARDFQKSIHAELESIGTKLFNATVLPRPAFIDAFLVENRRRFVFTGGEQLPFSDTIRYAMVACHNILSLEAGRGTSPLEVLRRELTKSPSPADGTSSHSSVMSGDIAALERALAGMRLELAGLHNLPVNTRWSGILPQLHDASRRLLVILAAKCPLVWLIDEDWRPLFPQTGVLPEALDVLLESDGAESLRMQLVEQLVTTALTQEARIGDHVRRPLEQCLETGTAGGAVIVAEFLRTLVMRLFGSVEQFAAAPDRRGAARHSRQDIAKDRGRFRTAHRQFRQWFVDLDDPSTAAFFDLLMKLVDLRTRLADRAAAGELAEGDDARMWLLERHWRAICLLTTRGLRDRPWNMEAQESLRMFWLNFCCEGFRFFEELPAGLSTGIPEWDDMNLLACRIVARFRLRVKRFENRLQNEQSDTDSLADEDDTEHRNEQRREIETIRQRLRDHVLSNQSFLRALFIRRMLTPVKDSTPGTRRFEWDDDRVEEMARMF